MDSGRLEAFSDGVLAIIITVMVLELQTPHGDSLGALWHDTGSALLTYLLSFVYIGIYWSNHHHLFQLAGEVGGGVLWANLHLLFWLSLFPFTTRWIDESSVAAVPTAIYGVDLLAAAVAYYVLQSAVARRPGAGDRLRGALGTDVKGKISPLLCLVGIGLTFVAGWLALVPYVALALMWLVPDRRVERYLAAEQQAAVDPARG